MSNQHHNILNNLVAKLQQQLNQLQNTDDKQFVALDTLLQQAAAETGNDSVKDTRELLQFLSTKIDDAETMPLKQSIINKAIKHLQAFNGNDLAGKIEHTIRNVLSEMEAEEKQQQTKAETERNERINDVVEKSIAAALKKHGF